MKLIKVLLILTAIFIIVADKINLFDPYLRGIFFFPTAQTILVNDENLIPPFSPETHEYNLITLNTFLPNKLTGNDFEKSFELSEINPEDYLIFFIGFRQYKIHLFNTNIMPTYQVKSNHPPSGFYFLTPFNSSNCSKAYAYIVDEKGHLLYYRRNQQEKRCVSDFKKSILPDGKIRYTLMEQERSMPPTGYHFGHLLVMDENFKPLKKLYLLPHGEHGTLQTENHESLYLNDNHYILSGYYETEVYHPETDEPISVVASIVQEIKDNKVIFEFNSTDYPEFLNTSMFSAPATGYFDYMHYNALAIDPKDKNWILSFAHQSVLIKIDRVGESGKILWKLGGKENMFSLKPHEYFAFQHKPVFVNNDILLFDNSVYRNTFSPINPKAHTRILRFSLNEETLSLSDFHEFPVGPSVSMGNVLLTEDNTTVYSGGSNKGETCVEIDTDKKELFHLSLKDTNTYRCYKYKIVR